MELPTKQEIQEWCKEYGTSERVMIGDTYYWPIGDVLDAIKTLSKQPTLLNPCTCKRFLTDLWCPIHGVNGTNPGDGYWEDNE